MALAGPARRDRIGLCTALCAMLVIAPCSATAGQRSPKPFRKLSASALALRDSVVTLARAQVGRKYVHGGTIPSRGFDCSGLVKYVLHSLRIEVPRTSREQSTFGNAIARDPRVLRPGDLLLFGKANDGVSHVGIYVGNGRFVHASSVAGRVIESPLNRPPSALIKVLMSARRVVALADTASAPTAGRGAAAPGESIGMAPTATTAPKDRQ